MAEESSGEKTEKPTGRRISQARTQGQVARSAELSQTLGLVAGFIALQNLSPLLWHKLQYVVRSSFTTRFATEPLTTTDLVPGFIFLLNIFLPILLSLFVIAAIFGTGTTLIQTKFLWSLTLLKPKFHLLHPISGLKRLLSIQNAMNILKQLLKLAIIGPIAYSVFLELFPSFLRLMDIPVNQLLPFTANAASTIFWRIVTLLFVLAICDYLWQRYSYEKQLKMTKAEVKDERKALEGDETTKQRIRAHGLQRARQRILDAVKKADVVVTNPTHFAVALAYDINRHSAPQVIAKGRGFMALTIIRIARENRVPVIERKPLARALFKAVDIGQTIPYELFAACAEILAYVYRLKRKNPFTNRAAEGAGEPRE